MMRPRLIAIVSVCVSIVIANTLFAATLTVGNGESAFVLTAGKTIEIPLSSASPIASNLTAIGDFQLGDVTITDGPGCHLSHNHCTLLITASPKSKDYRAVPVVVGESAATNIPVFALSVIQPGESTPHVTLSNINATLIKNERHILRNRILSNITANAAAQKSIAFASPKPVMTLTAGGLSAVIESHTAGSSSYYASASNGPIYQLINITNNGAGSVTLDIPTISGTDASSFNIDTTSSDYAGTPTLCSNAPTLTSSDSCVIIITSTKGDPASTPKTATLTISDGVSADTLTFSLTDTTYVYAAGGFNTLGNGNVSGGDLLAECTAGTCSNALQGTTGNNYADTNFSVGKWINALSVTATGNLMVGGVFGAIGGATSSASSGTAALLAQCLPGSTISGNACFNQMNNVSNNYAFNNAYIDAITPPISGTGFIYLGGDFTNIRTASTPGGRMLAKCSYSGAVANQACTNYLTAATTKYANNAIAAVDYLNSKVSTGGLFTQIAAYPTSVPSSGTTFASCTTSVCSQGMSSNPSNSILGMTDDGTQLYIGGAFTQAGGYTDSSGGYPLLSCTPATVTNCNNALAGSNDANGYIEGLTYSGGNLYVGGKFTTIGGATPVSGGNMLAVCTPSGSCTNFVTDTNPYATGTDWGGQISAIAVGNQTTITAN